jgi:hypothetical protein
MHDFLPGSVHKLRRVIKNAGKNAKMQKTIFWIVFKIKYNINEDNIIRKHLQLVIFIFRIS